MIKDIKFYKTRLAKRLLQTRTEEDKSFKNLFKKKEIINDEIEEEIRQRLTGEIENFVTIIIKGEQGSMKSSVGLTIANKQIDPDIKIKQVHFLYDEFTQAIKKSPRKKAFILDEQVFLHGTGSRRLIDEVQTLIETLRKEQNSMIIITPEEKYFPEEIFTFVMETIDHARMGTCKENKNLHETRTCTSKKHDIKKVYVRLAVKKRGRYIGFYIQEITWNNPLWKEYEKRKDAFLKISKAQDFKKLDYEKQAQRLLKKKGVEKYKTLKQLKLLIDKEIPNLSIEEKNLLAEQIKIMRKEYE